MEKMATGSIKQSLGGDRYCGDQLGHWQTDHQIALCIVDGLGHGKYAQIAAKAALTDVSSHLTSSLPEIFSMCNQEIRDTRGVAMGIAIIDKKKSTLTYAGIGNTRALILPNAGLINIEPTGAEPAGTEPNPMVRKSRCLRSDFGIVGGGYKRLIPETIPFAPGDIVLMYTDGVKELIKFTGYKASLYTDMQRLAETIAKDWGRDNDDKAVLAYLWD